MKIVIFMPSLKAGGAQRVIINIINKTITCPTRKPKAVASTILFIVLIRINIAEIDDIKEINFKATNHADFFNSLINI